MTRVDLSKFDNSWYRPGNVIKRTLWLLCSLLFVSTALPYPSFWKRLMLQLFGAKVGAHVTIKPGVRIKYPWFLAVGDNVWLGEDVWIDNLTDVRLGNNVCISQGAYVLTGNHDYKKEAFDLILKPVTMEDGVWVGAKAVVCPGVLLKSHSILTVGSVLTKDAEADMIYGGNPAVPLRRREIGLRQ